MRGFSDTKVPPRPFGRGFSLMEMLAVITIAGIMAAMALPYIGDLRDGVDREKSRRNAQQIVALSTAINGLGIAHVMPDSLGGVPATARLLREGITVTAGPIEGERIALAGLTDPEIEKASEFLEVVYLANRIILRYLPEGQP